MTDSQIIETEMRLGIIPARTPHDVIVQATTIAQELAAIVKKNHLSRNIQGREYVYVEGWSTMGAMLGVLPREVTELTKRFEDGAYEATVELIRTTDGAVVGRASAYVGMDEKDRNGKLTWGSRPEYARRSMAITRATGKAYRLGFSWIMGLAGYAPTPAEEMDGVTEGEYREVKNGEQPAQPPQGNGKKTKSKVSPTVQALIDNGIAENAANAAAILNKSPYTEGGMSQEELIKWGKLYRGHRDEGMEADAAAEQATSDWLDAK